jgi:hypothetical protein
MPLALQHTKGDQAAGDMMELGFQEQSPENVR